MCGRCALTLGKNDIIRACAYKRRGEDKYRTPKWIDGDTLERRFEASPNVAPTDITPVLRRLTDDTEYVLEPMLWGMIPPWHKGSHKSHGLQTNNCRIENVFTSKLYGEPLKCGKRCVVLAEGFYEWQTTDKTKKPHYIFMPQNDDIKMYDMESMVKSYDEDNGWTGVKLLKMAGLYNRWTGDEGTVKSYSIITMESNETLSWLHHRMPAILETEEDVENWLDVQNVSHKNAISLLKPAKKLSHYPVSTVVNNSRNKDKDCNLPVSVQSSKKSASQNLMQNWLKRSSKSDPDNKVDIVKKHKHN